MALALTRPDAGVSIRKAETIRDKRSTRKSELEGEKRKGELEDGAAGDRPRGVNDETAVSENLKFTE